MPAADRRQALEAMAQPGTPLRLLAEEQLALMDVAQSDTQSAIDRYQAILNDAEVNPDLQQRALQVIVALGGWMRKPALWRRTIDAAHRGCRGQEVRYNKVRFKQTG